MIEKIKVGEDLVLALFPYNGDFTGFECPMRLIPHALKKFSCWIIGVKLIPLLGLNVL
ncbi:hypothetical protein HPHPP4D_1231 [Helicobacter pylori Hp P-4d]|uniref:Uncharacterized protein n=1 Tax=Helicobacter pylori Hp P-4 TaxID=992075 RepID=I9WEU9_HELPX|nr:hypothetical protein HPHPP4_0996 [Helicobacter pylori Hp P-4]EJC22861.1 hypothetical protein HPHPP4D_1231 [Helicobacter pylori Hp P-4d]EJC25084.1 hypothetical protein HPHPP4C_1040 [Helicobacter pylori Hp P-4c]